MTADFEDDACDVLERSDAAYMLIVFIPESTKMRVHSNLGGNEDAVKKMIRKGRMARNLLEHIDDNYPPTQE